jgi:hypothetical protein
MSDEVALSTKNAAAAVALRLAGANYTEIAETLGFHDAAVAQAAVERHLASIAADTSAEKRDELRATEGARIDRLIRSVWTKATTARDPEHLPAVRTALALIDRRIKLYGLDAPTTIAVYSPTTSEIDAWVASMSAQQADLGIEEPDLIVLDAIDVTDA